MYIRWQWLSAVVAAAPLAALATPEAAVNAQTGANPTLEQRLEQAEDNIRILERKLEVSDEAAAASAKSTAVVKASPAGFSIASADGSSVLKLRGNIAVDYRDFLDNFTPSTADTFLVRRARPYIEGTMDNIYDFRLMPDFGQGKAIIQDAWINARFLPWIGLQAGKFKAPVSLERLQLEQYSRFVETALTTDLVPYRDIGAQLTGSVSNGLLSYSFGYFNGTVDGTSSDSNNPPDVDNDGKKDWQARVFSLPFANSDNFVLRGFGIGLGGTYVRSTGVATASATSVTTTSLLPTYKTPGQQTLFSYRGDDLTTPTFNDATIAAGVRRRWAPQAYYYYGPVGLMTEYTEVTQQVQRQVSPTATRFGTLQHHAWMFEAAWFVTGEEESYASFTGRSTFQPGKPGLGAWELVARYHEISFDPDSFTGGAASFANPNNSPRKATAVGGGVNWYLNQNVKLQAMYEVTSYDGGLKNNVDRPSEEVLTTRFALVF
jgi:phosphate-selective porin OprO/OprP